MQEQPKRKPRIPLSPEELFYVIELKKIKQQETLEQFKATRFYKFFNIANICLAAFLTYCVLSILILCNWQQTYVAKSISTYGDVIQESGQRTICEIELNTTSGEFVYFKTNKLFQEPKQNDLVFLGKDYLFKKNMRVKLANNEREFFTLFSIASLSLCCFALALGIFIYKVNKHLTVNGLLMTFGLFTLASLYFVLI